MLVQLPMRAGQTTALAPHSFLSCRVVSPMLGQRHMSRWQPPPAAQLSSWGRESTHGDHRSQRVWKFAVYSAPPRPNIPLHMSELVPELPEPGGTGVSDSAVPGLQLVGSDQAPQVKILANHRLRRSISFFFSSFFLLFLSLQDKQKPFGGGQKNASQI